jgi:hypothetical protein
LPLISCGTPLLAGVSGDCRPVSSTSSGIPPFSFSWELEGPAASLLGTGVVLLTTDFLKAGFFNAMGGLAMAFTPLACELDFKMPLEGVGVPSGAFLEKKLRIDPFFDPALEFCFFNDGGAGVSDGSFFTILAGDCGQPMSGSKQKRGNWPKNPRGNERGRNEV